MEPFNLIKQIQLSVILALLVSAFLFGGSPGQATLPDTRHPSSNGALNAAAAPSLVRVQEMLLSRPLSFVPNQGQAPSEVKYFALSGTHAVMLTPRGGHAPACSRGRRAPSHPAPDAGGL